MPGNPPPDSAARLNISTLRRLPLLILAVVGCSSATPTPPPSAAHATARPAPADGPDLFRDVTAETGIDFTYRNGEEAGHFAIIESLGGGVALFDYDRDGLLDVFLPGGGLYEGMTVRGHPCRLHRNLGGWKFRDVTADAGLTGPWAYTHGAAAFDYDNDGWTDLLVTGYSRLGLWHNVADGAGGRRFVEVTAAAGLADALWSTSAGWGDLDGDGFADLYVAHYGDWGFSTNHPTDCSYDGKTRDVCQPRKFKPLPHTVYRNNRDGTFADASAGLKLRTDGKGIGVVIVDVNLDGRPDVYAANDTDDNFLYMNRGTKPGELRLEEVGLLANVARDDRGQANGSMGVDAGDYDASGKPSIVVTNYENELPALYQNRVAPGREWFQFATPASGLGAIGGLYVSWGVGFADLDRDAWEDVVIVSGHAIRFPAAKFGRQQRPMLALNRDGRFTPAADRGGPYFRAAHNARGLAFGDLDNDGRLDAVVSHLNEPVAVLRNAAPDGPHWVGFDLRRPGHADVVGARVVVEAGGRAQTRFAKGGGSYAATNDRRLLFGLGPTDRIDKVTVFWPDGPRQEFAGVTADAYHTLRQGEKNPVPFPGK